MRRVAQLVSHFEDAAVTCGKKETAKPRTPTTASTHVSDPNGYSLLDEIIQMIHADAKRTRARTLQVRPMIQRFANLVARSRIRLTLSR